MKNNKNMKRMIIGTAAVVSLFSMSVVASEMNEPAKEGYEAPVSQQTIDQAQKDGIMLINQQDNNKQSKLNYRLVEGTISEVTQEEDYLRITIENDDMGMVFIVQNGVFVIDQSDGSYKSLEDLKEGMKITGVLANNSIMTMSLPPITPGAAGFIINAENKFMDISVYNNELVNEANTLSLHIGENTIITDIKGSKKVFTAEDIKNNECIVFYDVTTRSIPAQTTPAFVMILDEGQKESAATQKEEQQKTYEMTPVRELAEKSGLSITWKGNDKPVILEKDGVKIEITVDSDSYKLNGVQSKMTMKTELREHSIYVSTELENIF